MDFFTLLGDVTFISSIQHIDTLLVKAMTKETESEHIARIMLVFERYQIDDASLVFKVDETGCNFERIERKCTERAIG